MNDSFQQPGQWHNLILTPEHRPTTEPKTHIMSYTLKNLHPGGYYEAIVQAKNRYGWNEVRSTMVSFCFHTIFLFSKRFFPFYLHFNAIGLLH